MLACEPLVAACAPGHPLAGRHGVSLTDLAGETFVDLTPEWGNAPIGGSERPGLPDGAAYRLRGQRFSDPARSCRAWPRHRADARGRGRGAQPDVRQPVVAFAELAEPEPCWELAVVFAHSGEKQPVSAVTRMFLDLLRSSLPDEADPPPFAVQDRVPA